MAAPPNLAVAFAFGVNPGTVPTAGQWVDVTAYVESVSVSVGRDDEFSEPSAGTCTLVLSNVTGRFDPEFAAGPYYGNLRAMCPVRVLGGVSSADTAVFYGWVNMDGFQERPAHPADSVVTVTAVDAFELLAHSYLAAYLLDYERSVDSPTHVWKGGTADSVGAVTGVVASGSYTGAAIAAGSPNASLAGTAPVARFPVALGNADWVIETLVNSDATDALMHQFTPIVMSEAGFGDTLVQLSTFSTTLQVRDQIDVSYTSLLMDARPHHLALSKVGSLYRLYVDGVLSQTVTKAGTFTYSSVDVGVSYDLAGTSALDDLAIYPSLSAARILLHAQAALGTAYAGDTTGARIDRLLTMGGWPSSLRLLEPGTSRMPALILSGQPVLPLVLEAAKAEDGRFWVDHSLGGAPRFTGRYAAEVAGAHRLSPEEEGFETGIGRWSGANTGTTVAQSGAQAHSGTKCLAITATALVGGYWWASIPAQPATFPATPWNGFAVTSGREYRIALWVRSATIARTIGAGFAFLAADGTPVGFLPADIAVSSVTTGWTHGQTAAVVAPPAAWSAWLYVYGNVAGGEVTHIDDVYVIEGPVNAALSPVLIVLGDDGTPGTTECVYEDVDLVDDRIIDVAVTSRRDGPEFTATSSAGLTQFLDRPYSDTGLELLSDAEAKARGERLVNVHGQRRRRVRSVRLRPAAATHPAWTQVFSRRIGDRVQIRRRPRYGGTVVADGAIEGLSHAYSVRDGWSSDLKLSPVETDVATWDYGTWDNAKWGY